MVEEILKNARLSAGGRRLFTSEQKAVIVESWESSGLSCPEFCRRYGMITSQLYKWRSDAKSGAIMGIKNEGELHSKTELEILRKENEELKKALGESTLDIKILKKKLEMDQQKKKKWNSYPRNSK
ncbi:transposase [Flammeovirga yaeyamensis]|uniref:Transposase n=1 Tax=Flammeovirga yaeyamensis TaxID=367791 RepID=A0AAX1NED0_9BACT|nr:MULTISPECIES: transposase [Flammeovirga]ANQ51903.1 transposase [Flammeovirga sp. MY04]MBB3699424.1 transposase-like protein [Flammeovirga yaeyamensis]NMF35318.1 transposase [Flammeovirga yaeyamensis]QWG04178.1 transposase [Flammeovirga yaeyamensis]